MRWSPMEVAMKRSFFLILFLSLLFPSLSITKGSYSYSGHGSSSHGYSSHGSSSSYSHGKSSSHGQYKTHSSRQSKNKSSTAQRDSHGRIKRDPAARHSFMKSHPCPSTGKKSGSCPGYVVDHVTPLKRGGADDPSNMQWQTVADAKRKDKVEKSVKIYTDLNAPHLYTSRNNSPWENHGYIVLKCLKNIHN